MNDDVPIGQRFSLIYLRQDTQISDSPRIRRRLKSTIEQNLKMDSVVEIGRILERKLGIDVLSSYAGRYHIDWNDVLKWEMRDVLDAITLVGRFLQDADMRYGNAYAQQISSIFEEENASYRIDKLCGVHPAIDVAYQANLGAAIRSLGLQKYRAARDHVSKADDELMPSGNYREAIRSIFDAVENTYKQIFPKSISINKANIQSDLKLYVANYYTEGPERRAALKNVEALIDWVDACHNYRHEPGHPDPTPPKEELAVLIVSQGIGYVRWFVDLMRSDTSSR